MYAIRSYYGGIKNMGKLPGAVFIVDPVIVNEGPPGGLDVTNAPCSPEIRNNFV